MRCSGSFLTCMALLMAVPVVHAASFDCAKARSAVEKTVCADAALSRLDEDLAAAFKKALAVSDARPALRDWQRGWLNGYELQSCTDAACMRRVYRERIDLLGRTAPAASPAGRWTGRYVRHLDGKPDRDSATLLLIGLADGRVWLDGQAFWIGPNAEQGQVNEGSLELFAPLRNDVLTFDEGGDCKGELRRVRGGVQMRSGYGCGGLNVTFTGFYRRRD